MVDDAGCCFAVVVVVEIVVTVGTVVAVIGFVVWFSVGLMGVFFFFPPFCTWVHPSSLSGGSPVSDLGLSLDAVVLVVAVVAVAAAAAAIVAVVVVVIGCIVLVVF